MYGVFDVELNQQTEKCMVGVVSNPDGGCCSSCFKPLAARLEGYCLGCATRKGVSATRVGLLSSDSPERDRTRA